MISYIQKCFLPAIYSWKISFFTTLLGGISTGLSSGLSSGIGSLFSSSPSTDKELMKSRVASGMGPQPTGEQQTRTSSPLTESIQASENKSKKLEKDTWQSKAMDFAGDLAGKATSRVMEHMVDKGMSKMFEKSPKKRAMQDAMYDRIRFPDVSPWEIAHGGSSGTSQGGQGAADIGATAKRVGSGISAGATTDAAKISSSPLVTKVEQRTPAENEKDLAQAEESRAKASMTSQQEVGQRIENNFIKPLRQIKIDLEKSMRDHNQQKVKESIESAKLIQQKAITETKDQLLKMQQRITQMAEAGHKRELARLTAEKTKVEKAYANITKTIRDKQDVADLILGLGITSAMFTAGAGLFAAGRGAVKGISNAIKRFRSPSGKVLKNPYVPKSKVKPMGTNNRSRSSFKESTKGSKPVYERSVKDIQRDYQNRRRKEMKQQRDEDEYKWMNTPKGKKLKIKSDKFHKKYGR